MSVCATIVGLFTVPACMKIAALWTLQTALMWGPFICAMPRRGKVWSGMAWQGEETTNDS